MLTKESNSKANFKFEPFNTRSLVMASRLYALESSWNRAGHQIDECFDELIAGGMDPLDAKIKSVAEYSMECAITKVYGSETESYIVDEALQIHGGMGFSAESEISVHYRNVRGNRIYEGTNEINRILIPTMLLRKAMKGELPFMEAAMKGFQELQSGALKGAETGSNTYDLPMNFLKTLKKLRYL